MKLFPNGDLTEVGERGISISGGQKQRISICRAIYRGADIQIFDVSFSHVSPGDPLMTSAQDPLSALDAYVGKSVFQNIFMNNRHGSTNILATHALHFLPHVDYIYTIADGQIMERGAFPELMEKDGIFSKLMKEFCAGQNEGMAGTDWVDANTGAEGKDTEGRRMVSAVKDWCEKGKADTRNEERKIASATWGVYKEYLLAGRGYVLVPALLFSLLLVQGAQVMSRYWLVLWQEEWFHQPAGFYVRASLLLFVPTVTIFVLFPRWAFMLAWESRWP